MNTDLKIRKSEDYKTSAWSGGTTTELFLYPPEAEYKAGDFQVRISSATVELAKSEFTNLPGVKRYLMTLEGNLDMIHGVNTKVSLKPYEVDAFDGGIPTVSYGKVRDFNLMLKNGADGEMEGVILAEEESRSLTPEENNKLAVYVGKGEILVGKTRVKEGELLLLDDWKEAIELKNAVQAETKLGICKMKIVK